MSVTVTPYDHMARLFANGGVDIANLKVMLLSGYTLDTSHTSVSSISSSEVSGNGWPVGGPTIANAAVTTTATNDAMLDGDDVSVTASGGDIGPADAAIVYDATNDNPLVHYAFGGTQTAVDGTPFQIAFNAAGIINWSA